MWREVFRRAGARRLVIGSAVGLVLIGGAIGGVAYAQSPTPGTGGQTKSFVQRLAERLGLPQAQVEQAVRDARGDVLNDAVGAGRLTQEQADRLKNRPVDGAFGGPWGGPRGGKDHGAPGWAQGLKAEFGAVARWLGLSEKDLKDQLKQGKSLSEVAVASGKTENALVDQIVQDLKDRTARAVQSGRLTQVQADQMLQNAPDRVRQMVQMKRGAPGPGQRGGQGRGPRGGDRS